MPAKKKPAREATRDLPAIQTKKGTDLFVWSVPS